MALDWGYSRCNGPATWGKSFPVANGNRQSPVDIAPVNLKILKTNKDLTIRQGAKLSGTLENGGKSWKVTVKGSAELTGGPLEGRYVLEQFHCHWGDTNQCGSEHTVDGEKFAGELHLVYWNIKYKSLEEAATHPDGLCVLGVFLTPGKQNNELEKIVNLMPKIEFKGQSVQLPDPIDLDELISCQCHYYTYQGSLTTPPCSECVIWIVFKNPIDVSNDQLDAFRQLKSYTCQEKCPADEFNGYIKINYRPTLPLGQREIHEFRHN